MSATCKGCGARIVWVDDVDSGKSIPLDPKPPVWSVDTSTEQPTLAKRVRGTHMVSHFATCPNANEFSASSKQGEML